MARGAKCLAGVRRVDMGGAALLRCNNATLGRAFAESNRRCDDRKIGREADWRSVAQYFCKFDFCKFGPPRSRSPEPANSPEFAAGRAARHRTSKINCGYAILAAAAALLRKAIG